MALMPDTESSSPGISIPSFLMGFGQPAKSAFCSLLSLRTAVFLVIASDVILGLLYIVESILLILLNGLLSGEFLELVISLLGNSVSVFVLPFALIGFKGLRADSWSGFHVYFLYKAFETFFICVFAPTTSYIYCYEQGWFCEVLTLFLVLVQKIGVDLYFTYLVWSVDFRLKNGMMSRSGYRSNVELIPMPVEPQKTSDIS